MRYQICVHVITMSMVTNALNFSIDFMLHHLLQ